MKKFIALLLAAMMLLSCVAALAEAPKSPDKDDLIEVDPPFEFDKEKTKEIEDKLEELDLLEKLDEEDLEKLTEIYGDSEWEIAEVLVLKLTAAGNGEPVKVTFKFPTDFTSKTVAVLFDLETEHVVIPATVDEEDGHKVTVEFQPDVLQKLADFCAANETVLALFLQNK